MPPFVLALLLAVAPAATPSATLEAIAAPLDTKVQSWRRDIHQHPELGNREFRTARKVAEHLRALGLDDIRTGVAHTGVTAVLRGARPGPRLALRADMDALPVTEATGLPFASQVTTEYRGSEVGVMHACGHDAHVAILMGVAEALAGMREQLAGEVLFVFQPAEEGPPDGERGGAELMLAEGVFERFKPDLVLGLHVWSGLNAGEIGLRSGPAMAAADFFRITVHGRQTHGSRPWGGVDPIAISAELISGAQHIVSRHSNLVEHPVVVSFGAVNGGIRENIIPDSVELRGTIRTFDEDMRRKVHERLKAIAEHTAAAHGGRVEHEIPTGTTYPATVNDPPLTARMRPVLAGVVGENNLREMKPITGAEDFSLFAREVPGLFFFVGSTAPGIDAETAPSNHSPQFLLDEAALRVGLRALLATSLEALTAAPKP